MLAMHMIYACHEDLIMLPTFYYIGVYNEEMLLALDGVMAAAARNGIRVTLVPSRNWENPDSKGMVRFSMTFHACDTRALPLYGPGGEDLDCVPDRELECRACPVRASTAIHVRPSFRLRIIPVHMKSYPLQTHLACSLRPGRVSARRTSFSRRAMLRRLSRTTWSFWPPALTTSPASATCAETGLVGGIWQSFARKRHGQSPVCKMNTSGFHPNLSQG